MTDNKDCKSQFTEAFGNNITREGADKLLLWLAGSDFFTAPASTRFHLAVPGGLCEHSLGVWRRLCQNTELTEVSDETKAICGLLHDVCKVGFYKATTRNVKNERTGEWEKKPYYQVEDTLPYGHGEKSVYILGGFIRLSREEAMAIRWHMGGFDDSVKAGSFTISDAFGQFPLAVQLHVADLQASYLDEKRENSEK